MKILTGNDLKSGAVTWWTGVEWSLHVEDAVDVGDNADTVLAREQAARRVTGAYAIDAARDGKGIRPAHIKERIRALGPTVRPDLTLKPADPDAGPVARLSAAPEGVVSYEVLATLSPEEITKLTVVAVLPPTLRVPNRRAPSTW